MLNGIGCLTVAAMIAVREASAVIIMAQDEEAEEQVQATADFSELAEIRQDMSDEMWADLEYVKEDVMNSGYWFVICLDVQQTWTLCEGKEPPELVPQLVCEEGDSDETYEEMNERCHGDLHRNMCRNKLLQYYAQMRKTEEIFEALMWLDGFRNDLHNKCELTMTILTDFPFYGEVNTEDTDELLDALKGIEKVQNSEDGSGSSFNGEFD